MPTNIVNRLKARQLQTQKQQGLGRQIISEFHNGFRFVAVANKLHYSSKWKTFHDFLLDYIPHLFGPVWGTAELKKSPENQHPIVQWRNLAYAHMKGNQSGDAQIQTAPMTGALISYISLSYNLYLLAHNVKLQSHLIKRLKDTNRFIGAKYETYVAAEFIKAGFLIELEDETDGNTTHCEFIATAKDSGKKYSVEAKARQAGKDNVSITTQLSKALVKKADYERVVFIDMNIQNFVTRVDEIMAEIRRHETELQIDHEPAPSAYLFITNYPFEYGLNGIYESKSVLGHGFKIPDFDFEFTFGNIRDLLKARAKHRDMFTLVNSMREHDEIPSTFDGEYPEFSFNQDNAPPRLIIGRKYLIPGKDGKDVEGELTTACVSEFKKEITGVYHTMAGENIIITYPMSGEELTAYKRQPETFFGVPLQANQKANTPLELFDFFYATYKSSPRERLLEFMKHWPNQDILRNTSTEELAITYCESLVQYAFREKRSDPAQKPAS
ncbi:MAG: hypothetical protein A2X28_07140 [Elusimicrobia bacterium GWA2_56_46]|nr:MAG: hypothetical protein A2X28_07140 [Elusimicrobia bacterium GWA2_56_46]OGR54780.1 MAG: hypothetical protein A2X39_10850 [Elusimicrobia bacterium GWC2_56_31]